MLIYVHKILPALISPLALVLYLILWSMISRRRWPSVMALVLLWVISMPSVGNWALGVIERDYPPIDLAQVQRVDAVVVLGGARATIPLAEGVYKYEFNHSVDRFEAGLRLIQKGQSDRLILTRGLLPWDRGVPEGEWLRDMAIERGIPADLITLTPIVANTEAEAAAIAQMIPASERIALVTSSFHMPRAMAVFQAKGVTAVPVPVDHWREHHDLTVIDFLPSGRAVMHVNWAAREMLGRLYYRLKYGAQTVDTARA